MNILIPDSWLREYLTTDAKPKDIQKHISLCGPSVERLNQIDDDTVYDIEVTTNRPDCMSVLGIAREAAAILPSAGFSAQLESDPFSRKTKIATADTVDYLKVKIDPKLCPRFSAVLIKNVSVKPSPKEIVSKLEKVGMRGLNNIIDISNLLMWELGQPVHIFDYDRIAKHSMILRQSRAGETITTLDGKTHTLPGGDIVIEDGSGSLIDLCGIMGGLNSSVTDETKNILLFVQTYTGSYIRRTSMSLAHRTAAAVLFEKDLPTEQVLPALEYGIQLIKQFAGGQPEPEVLDILSVLENSFTLNLPAPVHQLATDLIGVPISADRAATILKHLSFKPVSPTKVEVPFFRKHDISIPEDLIEEVARLYGYHNVPPVLMSGPLPQPDYNQTFYWENRIKTTLKYLGLNEVYTYSLVSKGNGLPLKNPLSSEWTHLRMALAPSHRDILTKNLGKSEKLDFFEIANVYLPKPGGLPDEQPRLIISTANPDYLRLKGIIEALLSDLGVSDFVININQTDNFLYWEIPLDQLLSLATDLKTYTPISKFSPIIEDVNLPHRGTFAAIAKQLANLNPLIKDVRLIDKYGDKLTLRLTFHSDTKQLASEDITPIRNQITAAFSVKSADS
jgi:phenylalanyl-tRNA synthetase beta chain